MNNEKKVDVGKQIAARTGHQQDGWLYFYRLVNTGY